MSVCVCALMDSWGHDELCVFAPVWMNVYACVLGCMGRVNPPWSVGVLTEDTVCATHVIFMFCAAFLKEPWNVFWGKIMLEQWEDGTEASETDEK